MEKIIMVIGASKDMLGAYSDNCDGIYAAGDTIEAVKADTYAAIEGLKRNLPEDRWPEQIKGDFEIEWKFDVQSFLEYYHGFMSLAGMEKMTGINQKQLAHYASGISKPRPKQAQKIAQGLHRLAREMMVVTV